jgi:hypothetical protein
VVPLLSVMLTVAFDKAAPVAAVPTSVMVAGVTTGGLDVLPPPQPARVSTAALSREAAGDLVKSFIVAPRFEIPSRLGGRSRFNISQQVAATHDHGRCPRHWGIP